MSTRFLKYAFCIVFIFSLALPGNWQAALAQVPQPGEPMVTGNPALTRSVAVIPYDVDIFGIYLVEGDQMSPVVAVPVEHVNIDQVTAKLSPDGYKVAYLIKFGSTGFSRLVMIKTDGLNDEIIFKSNRPDQYIASFEWSHDSSRIAYALSADPSVFSQDIVHSFEDPQSAPNPLDESSLPQGESRYTGEVWVTDIVTRVSEQLIDKGAQNVLGWAANDVGIIFSHTSEVAVASDPSVTLVEPLASPLQLPAGVSIVSSHPDGAADLSNLLSFSTQSDQPVVFRVALLEAGDGSQKLAALSTSSAFGTTPISETTLSLAHLNLASDFRGQNALTLTPVLTSADAIVSLSLSPDGTRLAYSTEKEGALWAANLDGSNQAQILAGGLATTARISWNVTNNGVTALNQNARQMDVMSLGGNRLGSLTVAASQELLAASLSAYDVRNYNVPFIHQLWDTSDGFDGKCACGSTAAVMALAFYGKLPAHPITISRPYPHQNEYGFYVADKFGNFQISNTGRCPKGYGIYGQTIVNDLNGRDYIARVIQNNFGIKASWAQYQATFDIIKSALDRGHLVILGTGLTGSGHILLVKGYTSDGQLIVNDPYGDKFGGTYGKSQIDGANKYYAWGSVNPWWYIELEGWVPTPTITQWKGEYFNNPTLSGQPSLVRNEPEINFNWGRNAPANGIAADDFSVRWTRTLYLERGTYRFQVKADDGVRLYVDNYRVIDAWRDQVYTAYASNDIFLVGGIHTLRMEYYEHTVAAAAQLTWGRIDPNWQGEYYNNRYLDGSPIFVRNDDNLYFNWGKGGPGAGIGNDNFSARWTKSLSVPRSNYYQIYARSDDGVRVWLDGQLVIDAWSIHAAKTYTSDWIWLSDSFHTLQVEYYENTGDAFINVWITPGFYAEYYNNRNLSGSPVLTKYHSNLRFDWGKGGPAGAADNFSARWTSSLSLSGGDYRFCTRTDDGVRLYVDGGLIINQWRDMGATTYCAVVSLSKSFHEVKMEYYEKGGSAYAELTWAKLSGAEALGDPIAVYSATSETDLMTLYNDQGYLGPIIEADLKSPIILPFIYLPILKR